MSDLTAQELRYVAARDALAANLGLQERLKETLDVLEDGISANADQQAKIQAAAITMNRSGWYTGLRTIGFSGLGKVGPKAIGPSRFWFTAGSVPEPNEDTKKLYEAYTYLPHTFALRKWTKEEDEALEKFVLHAVQDAAHLQYMRSVIDKNQQVTGSQVAAKMESIAEITLDSPGSKEAVVSFDKQRWDVIATQHNRMRTGADCLIRWTNHLCPALRKLDTGEMEPWGKEEEATMCQIAEAKGERNWEEIAAELNTGRSAAQCLSHFRRIHSLTSSKPWSDAEMKQLQTSYAKHANKSSNFWKAVAADLPGRTFSQCMHFWRNQMAVKVKKGRWSPEEDEALRAAVEVYGRKWARVAEAVPNRTQVQVRERFVNVLDPLLKRKKQWTPEEDAILVEALSDCKNADGSMRWADIARRLPGRTDDVVQNHAITLRNFKLKEGKFKEKEKDPKTAPGGQKAGRASQKRKRKGDETVDEDNTPASVAEPEETPPVVKQKGRPKTNPKIRKRAPKKNQQEVESQKDTAENPNQPEELAEGGGTSASIIRQAVKKRPRGRQKPRAESPEPAYEDTAADAIEQAPAVKKQRTAKKKSAGQ